jgi:hypothetical protein
VLDLPVHHRHTDEETMTTSNGTTRTMRVRREDLVSRQEAADILGVHPNQIDKMGRDRILRRFTIKSVRRIFYLRSEVEGCIVELGPDDELEEVTVTPGQEYVHGLDPAEEDPRRVMPRSESP